MKCLKSLTKLSILVCVPCNFCENCWLGLSNDFSLKSESSFSTIKLSFLLLLFKNIALIIAYLLKIKNKQENNLYLPAY